MEKKNTKIIFIAVGVIIASLCVAYFLDFAKWKEVGAFDAQIKQAKVSIEEKKSYYAVIDSKMEALISAGWATKKPSIEANFTSTPFFIPKINTFFQTVVLGSGMKMSGITSSAGVSVKGAPQSETKSEGTAKSSKATEVVTVNTTTASYFDRVQGPIKKTTVNLSVSGTYSAFRNLLSQFENQTRIITIKSVAVSPAGQVASGKGVSANNLTFSMVLDIYSY